VFADVLQWRMQDAQKHAGIYKQCAQIAKRRPDLIKNLKATIATNGPLSSRELESSKRGPGMWEWSDTKKALEYLFWTGEITTRGRRRFERLYDLTENSIPAAVLEKCKLQRQDAQMEKLISATTFACPPLKQRWPSMVCLKING